MILCDRCDRRASEVLITAGVVVRLDIPPTLGNESLECHHMNPYPVGDLCNECMNLTEKDLRRYVDTLIQSWRSKT